MRDRERELQHGGRAVMPSRPEPFADPQSAPDPGPGQIVMGPSFYVWDEVPREAREWGIELANAWLSRRR